ncbi:L,D-transpeptidase family protein [Acinetobacter sp. MD2]|uniref:L,D-transpeptidase family protein n=1 Tax=Acinetobacter sp. MD2 TaxID=2600066 RepID=UPI002D1F71D0|nr:L,D-transpeptidase family protein [Acinetobacter sp. MD2]MEB3768186.1 L,D-transpeptidase family protein [Acinetobacter sp. MD2]
MKTRTTILFITLVLFVVLMACYVKYGKFLPTARSALHTPLSAQQIQHINATTPISTIKVYKSKRELQLFHHQEMITRYPMRLGFNPIGHKVEEGDGKTPEGHYEIDWRNPKSAFYKSLHISYPNTADTFAAQALKRSPGGNIMIHGSATKQQLARWSALYSYLPHADWTWGCIAVSNRDIDEIWQLVRDGTVIEIYP